MRKENDILNDIKLAQSDLEKLIAYQAAVEGGRKQKAKNYETAAYESLLPQMEDLSDKTRFADVERFARELDNLTRQSDTGAKKIKAARERLEGLNNELLKSQKPDSDQKPSPPPKLALNRVYVSTKPIPSAEPSLSSNKQNEANRRRVLEAARCLSIISQQKAKAKVEVQQPVYNYSR